MTRPNLLERLAQIEEEREKRLQSMMGDLQDGAIFRSGRRDDAFVMILPDLDGENRWRLQYFDSRGFSGHSLHPDQEAARRASAIAGYYIRDDGALDRIQNTPAFLRGNFVTDLIDKINAGTMGFAELEPRMAEYDRTHNLVPQ
jgi:hypothetical protein